MIHEAYMPVYMGSRFLARTDGTGRTEVVQEALADLKIQDWYRSVSLIGLTKLFSETQ